MDKIQRSRRFVRLRIARLEQKVQENIEESDRTELEELTRELKIVIDQLWEVIPQEEEEQIMEECCQDLERLASLRRKLNTTTTTIRPNMNAEVRLPQIDLPTFSGDLTQWVSFSDLFRAAVDNNAVSNAQKLQYLRAALKGEAAKLIQHLPIADDNYAEAWDLLKGRYDNKRHIANTIIQRFCELQKEKNGSSPIRHLLDLYNEVDKSLKTLAPNLDRWELIVTNILMNCLDMETKQAWELSLTTTEIPPLNQFLRFLEVRARAINTSGGTKTRTESSATNKCFSCKEEHPIYKCGKFEKLPVEKRRQIVNQHKLCFNCLSPKHTAWECKGSHCRKCNKKHHTLLHMDGNTTPSLSTWAKQTEVILPTVQLIVQDTRGRNQIFKALLDTGSHYNVISDRAADQLKLQKKKGLVKASTIAGGVAFSDTVILKTSMPTMNMNIECQVAKNLHLQLPSTKLKTQNWKHLENLKLADPEFNQPNNIEVILGARTTAMILEEGLKKGADQEPIAWKTAWGWVVSGSTTTPSPQQNIVFCQIYDNPSDDDMKRFWEIEEPKTSILTEEERVAEKTYEQTTRRCKDGVYEVRYPFNTEPPNIGTNRQQAVKRFLRLEEKLHKENIYDEYKEVIQEYQRLGHLVPVKPGDDTPSYYLPHHAVIKESDTTRLRVVFDGSSKTTNGNSINDVMLNGPKLQDDLWAILIRFRTHKIAICADIEKMYRQIRISKDQQRFQRILWRDNKTDPLKEYQLTTVTFGMKASPYLAIKTLQRLAADEGKGYPEAASVLVTDFYVDDVLTGADTPQAATKLANQLSQLLTAGGFTLRKWCSNEESTFQNPTSGQHFVISPNNQIKTLGLHWDTTRDAFQFKGGFPERQRHTKRTLLSDAARIFDPLGWLSPVTVIAKIIFQDLWRLPLAWDDTLPENIHEKWKEYLRNFSIIEDIIIHRYTDIKTSASPLLCGFCDASEKAYGAVIYLRTVKDKKATLQLLTAKTKVAPIKPISIPRLELCATVLLSTLVTKCQQAFHQRVPYVLWTDSTVVLHWIKQDPSKWKPFVAHRVAAIQEMTDLSSWGYVASADNPADLLTKGLTANKLKTSSLWWNGPTWLQCEPMPQNKVPELSGVPETRRNKGGLALNCTRQDEILPRFSSLWKLIRVTAFVRRFINRITKRNLTKGPLTVQELNEALFYHIKEAQEDKFKKEIQRLTQNQNINKKSNILSLTPFIDGQGILRVGGRLKNAPLDNNQKHQIILPTGHRLTELILQDIHNKTLHGGSQLMLASLRQKYWVPKARSSIRKIIRTCVKCQKYKQERSHLMGQLPECRTTLIRPFLHVGIDYCGPILCKEMIGRARRAHKTYVAVFVCMATKAVHLEAVSNLTMEAFLTAFERFISRRGLPSNVYSDNGRNFVAANRQLRELREILFDQEKISNTSTMKGIQWHFNPPYSPHFGGLWEAAVKSLKYHLRRIMGNETLTFEELTTVLCRIEACLNSRPLCPMSEDPEDLDAITPGHFLIGHALNAIPEPKEYVKQSIRSRYHLKNKITDHLWQRWYMEYLSTLQTKTKWKYRNEPLKIGDLVVIKDKNMGPQQWQLGRILNVSADADHQTRVIKIKTATGTIVRSRTNVIKLFNESG